MKNKLMKATLVFLCAFLGFAGGHMAQKLSFTYSMGPLNIFLASMGFIILSFVIHIVMHETGHLIFGRITGYQFILIRFFSITLIKTDQGYQLKSLNIPGTAGQCLMMPPKTMNEPFPTQLYNLGGIITNGVIALVSLGVLLAVPVGPYMQIFLTLLILLGIFAILVNGLIMEDTPNDGYNASLLRHRPGLRPYFWLQLYVIGMKALGKGYDELDPHLLQSIPLRDCDNPIGLTAQLIYIESLSSNRERIAAYEALQEMNMIPLQKVLVEIDHASCLMLEGEIVEPTPMMNTIVKKIKGNPDCLKFEYLKAVVVDKNPERGAHILATFLKDTKHYPYRHDVELIYKELMDFEAKQNHGNV
ncbi:MULTISPECIES: hypothetical protein [Erysipelothrix]|uniref:hypothetical protein n=1 Tax=Erysipelothrix TaxID=1647 RepID=UPI002F91E95C